MEILLLNQKREQEKMLNYTRMHLLVLRSMFLKTYVQERGTSNVLVYITYASIP
jgi:hypothetical protein